MDSTRYGNATHFDVDLHSIYAAYLGLFEGEGTDWWDKSWGGYFATFNDFLGFGWEVMVVVDSSTGRPHIAVSRDQIASFAKMIRTRFGESLPKDPPTTLPLDPVSTRNLSLRRLITLNDLASFRKLAQTLPAAELNYLRSRVRSGQVGVAEQLFYAGGVAGERDTGGVGVRDNGVGYSWACVKTTWWEKGGAPQGLVPGQGRSHAKGPGGSMASCPQENYRKSHFIIEEWVDKRTNTNPANYPRNYGFGKSRYVAEKDIERIVDATVGALASQENDSNPNTLILLSIGEPAVLPVPASSTLPHNILHLDVLALEFQLLRRAQQQGHPGAPDRQQPLTSLAALLQTLQIPVPPFTPLGNAGNDAFYTVLAFQKLLMAETRLPDILFSQPETFMSGYGYGVPFPQYPMLPPAAPYAGLNRSSSSQPTLYPTGTFPSMSSLQVSRRVSDQPRPRPASFGDSFAQELPRRETPELTQANGSVASTVKRQRQILPRSQTVFWDDAEYAGAVPSRDSSPRSVDKRPNLTGDAPRGRSSIAPPSDIRPHFPVSASSRSISWDEGIQPRLPGSGATRDRSSARAESSRTRPSNLNGSSGSIHREGLSASGDSSTKLSSEGQSNKSSGEIKDLVSTGEKARDKGKVKSDKSMKNLPQALARFWIG
ncbi:hypothetical protein BCR39DRAFT_557413 [Naematelia encephala]|uniref:Gfd2/YDR514C-like C-terminal domain-containing protein n=1 Tax=Naematelia encephala TaxID=71784 RepID=A0A1Y2BFJ2_9TREE|nr:hypothetical protein BCR39DRAFT_557413 [Naematelia encephala]